MKVLCAASATIGPHGQHAGGEEQHPRRTPPGQRAEPIAPYDQASAATMAGQTPNAANSE